MRISVTDNAGDQWLFDWEPSTGELSGPDGWWINRLMQLWGRLAALAGADPTAIDPRHSRAGMACFLVAHEFRLPDELRTDLSPCFWMVWDVRRRAAVQPAGSVSLVTIRMPAPTTATTSHDASL